MKHTLSQLSKLALGVFYLLKVGIMYKVREFLYSKEELEKLINKPGITLLGFTQDLMIFKEKVQTSRQLVAKTDTQKFFDMFITKTPNKAIIEKLESEFNTDFANIKLDILKFVNYWLEKGENDKKSKWEKQKTFEYISRIRTWIGNKREVKQKNNIGITSL